MGAQFGYTDELNVPGVLCLVAASGTEGPLDLVDTSYFLSTIEPHVGNATEMRHWRKRLFVATSQITTAAPQYFGLPPHLTVIMG